MDSQSNDEIKVFCPRGNALTLNDLPPENVGRWTIYRKAVVVRAVDGNVITLNEAMRRYRISFEEMLSWQEAVDIFYSARPGSTKLFNYGDSRV
jgi:hypothetical protein